MKGQDGGCRTDDVRISPVCREWFSMFTNFPKHPPATHHHSFNDQIELQVIAPKSITPAQVLENAQNDIALSLPPLSLSPSLSPPPSLSGFFLSLSL